MTMTDPIADMLTRIRNAVRNRVKMVRIPKSRLKIGIAEVLKKEGYIEGFELVDDGVQGAIVVKLKYGPDGEVLINRIERNSKPGRRLYGGIGDLRAVLNGLRSAV